MGASSVSTQTPQASAATGYMQADGFISPTTAGKPVGSDGTLSKGPALFPFGIGAIAGGFAPGGATIAAAGATQGNATAITTTIVQVTATASTEGVKLSGGLTFVCIPGSVGAKVYPPTNGKIGTHATNVAVVVPAARIGIFCQVSSTVWVAAASTTL